ncbi:hypothetical protein A8C32_12345 [Flavivirga aquatica]|uniref:Uncharacterized protein n=1 Tax=Flavivirga aquatica TaxID=1849968 RepID=A0A1E5TDP6_9FLAO|nr:zinc-dependent metalloprotease [Flavivirga aquatica]OEK09495.1 hypothetical protein A8C32_12345 [Flavivirga aquatica]
METPLRHVLMTAIFLCTFITIAQNPIWKKTKRIANSKSLDKFHLDENKVQTFELNVSSLKQNLSSATSRRSPNKSKKTIIQIPQSNGKTQSFEVYEAAVFSPELAAKYPNIKSYVGYSTDRFGTRLRMSISPQGIQAMISNTDKPTQFIQPTYKGSNQYVLYDKNAKRKHRDDFKCGTTHKSDRASKKQLTSKILINEGGANDQTLRKYRIAVSTTSEYTAYHDDGNNSNGDAIADALAAINATLTRVNQVYETDMAITFELVDATQLIYNNSSTDPYSQGFDLNGEVQETLTSVLGNDAYDIGHLFTRSEAISSAGCIACVCEDDEKDGAPYKGSAFTGSVNGIPEGDAYDISYVAHEIGHQMGANHTTGDNSEGYGVNSEPGSGSTIMGYAGATGSDDIQLESDPYFHYHSIRQIMNVVTNQATCWQTNNPGNITNNPPLANAGNDYNIPAGTAYVLKGAVTDIDGTGNLTYCWEQTDSSSRREVSNSDNFGPTLATAPMNRSLPPSNSPNRYIPRFSSVLAGNTTQTNPTIGSDWETVATIARSLNWALTVRDRAPANATGGQSSFDTMKITVENTVPFTVTNPVSWGQGSNQTIEWHVGQTTNSSINCQNVNIKLSTDGGATFSTTIASNTPNDGSYSYTVPAIPDTSSARLLIEAADNIFYDVSDFNFSISNAPSFFVNQTNVTNVACSTTSATYSFNFTTDNGFSENTVFSVSGIPTGSSAVFNPTSMSSSGSFTMTIDNIDAHGLYDLVVSGTSTSVTKNFPTELSIFKHCASSGDNDSDFKTATTLVQFNTINNPSGKLGGYTSYHKISTNVNQGNSYDLNVHANTDGPYDAEVYAWIDWNKDCDFDDPGEFYDLGLANNTPNGPPASAPLSITIPEESALGATVMRIGTGAYYGDDNHIFACDDTDADGEWEDYTINIKESLSTESFEFNNFNVSPNPNKGTFTVKLNDASSKINLEVFDIRGRIIYKNTYQKSANFNEEIKLNNVTSGLYLLKVSDDSRTSTRKIIIK